MQEIVIFIDKCLFQASIPWMTTLISDCKSWAGLSLQKAINRDKRNQIKDNEASLIEFRNYLFSRQCALLFLLGKPSEVSRRAVEFLYNTVLEIKNLKVKLAIVHVCAFCTRLLRYCKFRRWCFIHVNITKAL